MVDRIKQIMEYYKLSPASFAEVIGINRSNLTHLFSGRNQPSLDLAKKILHCYPDIKTEWLIMGMGDMFRNNEEKELIVKIQNEKRFHTEMAKPDLFSVSSPETNVTSVELPVVEKKEIDILISNPREVEPVAPVVEKPIQKPIEAPIEKPAEKESRDISPSLTVKKIVFFYSDNSFEVFHPNR
ncbi:MAG: helix-turn-helix transcriptional regulator [Lentimicrobiaceae bacterium]|nr:helix-turn-helix transcriptional regulator [Lentimicrobiaceae bacterium]